VLWESRDAKKWRDALASYWENPSVRNNLEVEKFIDKLDPEIIRKSNSEGWHGFLRVYFNWKFKGTYPGKRLADLEKNRPEQLFTVKGLLFTCDPKNLRSSAIYKGVRTRRRFGFIDCAVSEVVRNR
jgi:hypothetical protein